jgi:hypothetical protein
MDISGLAPISTVIYQIYLKFIKNIHIVNLFDKNHKKCI